MRVNHSNTTKLLPIEQRLMDVSRRNEVTGCLEATELRPHNKHGYRRISIQGKMLYAHRVSYETFVGSVPEGLHVLHKCHNPACIEPRHLYAGTHEQNMQDKVVAGRQARGESIAKFIRGEKNPMSKRVGLTPAKVRFIRNLWQNEVTQTRIAKMVGVALQTVNGIIHRRAWKHVVVMMLCVGCATAPAIGQGFVRLVGGDNGTSVPSPASASNPIPVSINGGTGGSVAVTSTVNPTGTTAANATSTTAAIPASSTTVTLTAAASNITLWNYSSTATLYFQPNSAGTATTSNFGIPPGFAFTFTGLPAISSFKVIGSAASGNYGVFAH